MDEVIDFARQTLTKASRTQCEERYGYVTFTLDRLDYVDAKGAAHLLIEDDSNPVTLVREIMRMLRELNIMSNDPNGLIQFLSNVPQGLSLRVEPDNALLFFGIFDGDYQHYRITLQ